MTDRKKNDERKRGGPEDDIMGISRGGGREQYGGSFGGGQSGGGAYANPHSGEQDDEVGSRFGTDPDSEGAVTGGQSNQGYYGGGQMGDRNYDPGESHNAASTAGGPDGGRTYADHPSQKGGGTRQDAARFDARNGPGSRYEAGLKGEHRDVGRKAPPEPDRRD